MNRRPGQVEVVTEVGYCPSCGRTRNLRREERHLGALVRTIVTCETCHRTLSSSMGVVTDEPVETAVAPEPEPQPVAAPASAPIAKKAVVKKVVAPAKKPAAVKKPAAKKIAIKKPAGKPTAAAARKPTRSK